MFKFSRTIRKYGSTGSCFAFELGVNSAYGSGRIALVSTRKKDVKLIHDHFRDLSNQKFIQLSEKLKEKERIQKSQTREPPHVSPENSFVSDENIPNSLNKLPHEPIYSSVPNKTPRPKPIVNTNNEHYLLPIMKPICNGENSYEQEMNDLIKNMETNHKNYDAYEIKIEREDREAVSREEKIIRNNNVALVLTRNDVSDDNDSVTFVTETDEEFYKEKYVPLYMSNKNLKSPDTDYFRDPANDTVYTRVRKAHV